MLRLPDLPVMVTVDVPADAEGAAVSVRMALEGVEPALNEPVTPAGSPEMLTVTAPAKPFCGVRVSVLFPAEPYAMLSAVGEADNVNVGAGVIVSVTVVLVLRAPEVPVIVTVVVEAAAVLAATKVTVLLPPIIGLSAAVTPAGSPDTASPTVALKPF